MSALDVRAIPEQGLPERPAPAIRHELRVIVSEKAFDRAVARGEADTTREVGGVLVGEVLRDASGPYLRVDDTIDALHAEEGGTELTFTHATWQHIHEEMDKRHAGKAVVGWYHTHPGFGIFLSDRDQFIHKSFFNLPSQIALVYDPKSREHGVYVWRDNEPWRARRWWVGAREQLWDGPRTPQPKERTPEPPPARASEPPPAELASMDWVGLGLGALVVALLGGLAGWWLGGRAGADAIARAQTALVAAKADGAKDAIGSLQTELVGLLRDTMGDEAIRRPVGEALADLDEARKGLEVAKDPRLQPALERLKRSRDRLVRLRDDRNAAQAMLTSLAGLAKRPGEDATSVARQVAIQTAVLGEVLKELAELAKADPKRARRLLMTAAAVDPGNHARYQEALKAIDPKAVLPKAESRK